MNQSDFKLQSKSHLQVQTNQKRKVVGSDYGTVIKNWNTGMTYRWELMMRFTGKERCAIMKQIHKYNARRDHKLAKSICKTDSIDWQ